MNLFHIQYIENFKLFLLQIYFNIFSSTSCISLSINRSSILKKIRFMAIALQVVFSAVAVFPLPITLRTHTRALNCRQPRNADKTDMAYNASVNGV